MTPEERLNQDRKKAFDDLIEQMHHSAKDYDSYQCGLPIYNEEEKEKLRQIVFKWCVKKSGILP